MCVEELFHGFQGCANFLTLLIMSELPIKDLRYEVFQILQWQHLLSIVTSASVRVWSHSLEWIASDSSVIWRGDVGINLLAISSPLRRALKHLLLKRQIKAWLCCIYDFGSHFLGFPVHTAPFRTLHLMQLLVIEWESVWCSWEVKLFPIQQLLGGMTCGNGFLFCFGHAFFSQLELHVVVGELLDLFLEFEVLLCLVVLGFNWGE